MLVFGTLALISAVSGFGLVPSWSKPSGFSACYNNIIDNQHMMSPRNHRITAFIGSARSTSIPLFAAKKSSEPEEDYDDEDYDDEDDDEEYYEDDDEDEYDEDEYAAEEETEAENDEDKEWIAEEQKMRQFLQDLDAATAELQNLDIDNIVANLSPEEIADIESNDVEIQSDEQIAEFTLDAKEVSKITKKEAKEVLEEEDDIAEMFPDDDDWIYGPNATLKEKDLIEFEEVYKKFEEIQEQLETGEAEINNIDMIDDEHVMMNVLDEHTRNEILNLDEEVPLDEDGDPEEEELHKQRKRLIYDLDFNITNVFLASFKVNADAPVILEHWMYEMRNWTRYEYVRQNDFNFTWDDVDAADTDELDRYWKGANTDGTPTPDTRENPNIIEWDENPLTFEEENLLALESWMEEVYQDDDDINLDDDDLMPEENPAAPEYGILNDDDLPPELKDAEEFEEKYAHMSKEWREEYVKRKDYEIVNKVDSDFRGHVVIACSPAEEDLDMSEKLTLRMEKEFGEQIFVETRVVGHAKPEDYLYEVWIESWEIELLHSKRRAVFQRDWDGPRDITDEYIDDLVSKVGFYISDDYRYSFLLGDDGKE